jgi:hypothetical protein
MRKLCSLILLAFTLPALAEEKPLILDVPALVHASQATVEERLGKPEFCRKSKYGLSCRYAPRGVEVAFTDGKAERIVINEMEDTLYEPATLTRLGFKAQEPNQSTDEEMRWTQLPGVAEVTLFPAKEQVDYALIVVTPSTADK